MSNLQWRYYPNGDAAGLEPGYNYHTYVVLTYGDHVEVDTIDKEHERWLGLDVHVASVQEGIQLCEMWEATGVY